ncbi:hypothetical protein BDZ94DRAFT_65324 [Collybia nuda]|uniref:F-box domain-containing protein n=1 Tax=Collybia nuda TaxID=64659 RepID=A0A9P6CFB7_9AGAR|nr:hypothetical protein BDZ94DRAFT_65324 [Collybia nuda]
MTTYFTIEPDSELSLTRSSTILSEDKQILLHGQSSEALGTVGIQDRKIAALPESSFGLGQQKVTGTVQIGSPLEPIASPVASIPAEMLHEIFFYCQDSNIVLPLSASSGHPWGLGHVCSRWREEIWNVSSLWRDIEVRKRRGGVDDWKVRDPLHDIISKRTTPIELYTRGQTTPGLFDFILFFNHRFRSLSITISRNNDLYTLLELPLTSFSNLEVLRLTFMEIHPRLRVFPNTFFQNIPDLRLLKLKTIQNIPVFEILQLPFTQLVRLSMSTFDISSETMYSILRQTTRLKNFHLRISSEPPFTEGSLQIVLSSLKFLNVELTNCTVWTHLFEPLVVPSLREMLITTDRSTFPTQLVTSLLQRSQCDIIAMGINPSFFDEEVHISDLEIKSLFIQTPSLIRCETGFIISPSIMRMIQDRTLLPVVRRGAWRFRPDGMNAFLDFADSCIQGVRPLQIKLGCYADLGIDEVRQRYQECRRTYRGTNKVDLTCVNLPMEEEDELDRMDDDIWDEDEGV